MDDDEGFVRDGGGKHVGPARTSPYPMSRLAPTHDLVDLARQISEADRMLGSVAGAKLDAIAEQMRALQEQARQVLEETQQDLAIHRARCSFQKRPGHVYHLYREVTGETWLSMIGPDEWGDLGTKTFEGTYRLELDQSFTRLDRRERDRVVTAQRASDLLRAALPRGEER